MRTTVFCSECEKIKESQTESSNKRYKIVYAKKADYASHDGAIVSVCVSELELDAAEESLSGL